MMMQSIRKHMKVILWVTIVLFLIGFVLTLSGTGIQGMAQILRGIFNMGSAGPRQGVLAYVYGHEITAEEYENRVQQRLLSEQNQKGSDLDDSETKRYRSEVWEEIINERLIAEEVNRLGIRVSDAEIASLLRYSPPEFIQQDSSFQTEGRFDQRKWEQLLMRSDPNLAEQLAMIEQNYRERLPGQKFITQLLALATVSNEEVWQSFYDDNLKARARYILFPASQSAVDTTAISQKQIEDYYYAHRQDYKLPEKRRALYVLFPEQPTSEDTLEILQKAKDLLQRLREGESFDSLARHNSEDVSAQNGGDLGFIQKGMMLPEFEAAAFATPLDSVTGPVQTRFGYHLIKVTEKKVEKGEVQVRTSHILLKFKMSQDTRDRIWNNANDFAEAIVKEEFGKATSTYNAQQVDTTDLLENDPQTGYYLPPLGTMQAALKFIFGRPLGSTSMAYKSMGGPVVFKILEVQKGREQTLEEAREKVLTKLVEEQRQEKALERCREFRQRVSDPAQLAALAQSSGLEVKETDREFSLKSGVRGVGMDPAFTTAALALEVNQISAPIKGLQGSYLIQLTEKILPDTTTFALQKDDVRSRLLNSKQQELYTQWLETAKKNAKIEDYRYLYYREY